MPFTRTNAERRRGFTLTELMVTVTILGVLTAASAPCFQKALVQSRADIAAANLRGIWAAERLYWLEYHTYTTNIDTLQDLGTVDKNIPDDAGTALEGYRYSITSMSPATAFSASAVNSADAISISINQDGVVQSAGITLTFQ